MSQQTQWHATVGYASTITELTDGQADALVGNLPGYGVAQCDGRRVRLSMTVEASTLRRATDEALKAAAAAYADAFDVVGSPVEMRVLTQADYEREQTNPPPMELLSIAEIAEKANVSRQRAHQLTERPDFPAPIAEPRAGKIFTPDSVDHFLKRWDRKTGRPAKVA